MNVDGECGRPARNAEHRRPAGSVGSRIVVTDCGFGRQGCNREIAFFKAAAIAQGCNIVRKELGLETTDVPAVNPALQTDIVPSGTD